MAERSLSPKAWVKLAETGRAGGAWLVYGFDEYVKSETIRLAAKAFVGDTDARFAVTHLVGAQTDSREILQATQAVSMLGERTAVIVHGVAKLAGTHKTRLADGLSSVDASCLLVLDGPAEPDRRTRMYHWFGASHRDVRCDPLTATGALAFARRRLGEQGSAIDEPALARLLALTGPEAGVIARETEKLSLYAGARITLKDVAEVAGLSAGAATEDLVAAMLSGRVPESVALSRRICQSGLDATQLVSRLCGHLYDLWRAASMKTRQSWQLAGSLRVSKARAEELRSWLHATGDEQLEPALEILAGAERLVRSGKADPDFVCVQSVLAVARLFESRRAGST